MSASINNDTGKPVASKPRRRATPVTPAIAAGSPFQLTADERHIAELFFTVTRRMEEHHRIELHKVMVRMAESMVQKFPRHRPAALCLVVGGAA